MNEQQLKNEPRNLEQYIPDLRELQHLWLNTSQVQLRWDIHYEVFASNDAINAYPLIFGSYPAIRKIFQNQTLRSCIGMVRRIVVQKRWAEQFHFDLSLPADAIVFSVINGLVMISVESGVILKILYKRSQIEREIETWSIAESAGIDHHLPKLIDYGKSSDGGEWIARKFVHNKDPLHNPLNPLTSRASMRRESLQNAVLPTMERFYEAAGIEILNLDDLKDELNELLYEKNLPDAFRKVLKLADKDREHINTNSVVQTLIHGDLSPSHIHRDNGNWWIIDWGSSHRNGIAHELFLKYFRHPESNYLLQNKFWPWLRGEVRSENLPVNLRKDIELFIAWHYSWLGITLNPETVRCQIIYYLFGYILNKVNLHNDNSSGIPLNNQEINPVKIDHLKVERILRRLNCLETGESLQS